MFRRNRSCSCMHNFNVSTVSEETLENINHNGCECNNYEHEECECGYDEEFMSLPSNPNLAQSYVPIQYINKTFIPEIGLRMGTIFPELVSSYVPCQSMEEISYLEKSNEIGEGCNR